MKSMLHIGMDAEQMKESLPTLTKSIIDIINTPAGDDVKKKALDILGLNIEVKDVSVSGCTFTNGENSEKEA